MQPKHGLLCILIWPYFRRCLDTPLASLQQPVAFDAIVFRFVLDVTNVLRLFLLG